MENLALPTIPQHHKALPGVQEMIDIVIAPQTKEIIDQLASLEVVDNSTLAIAKANASTLKKMVKEVQLARTSETKALDERKKEYMNIEKALTGYLEAAIKKATLSSTNYLDKLAREKAQKEAELQLIQQRKAQFRNNLISISTDLFQDVNAVLKGGKQNAQIIYNKYFDKKEGTFLKFAKLHPDEKQTVQNTIGFCFQAVQVLKTWQEQIINVADAKAQIKSQIENLESYLSISIEDQGEKEAEEIGELQQTMTTSAKGTYVVPNVIVTNERVVPEEFLVKTVDLNKIKSYAKEHYEEIKSGKKRVPGVSITYETKIRG